MMRVLLLPLAVALALPSRRFLEGDHELAHGHGRALCGCEKDEEDHPFTIDCNNEAAISAATLVLESETCQEVRDDTFEWGASFDTPDNSYKWVSQAKGGIWAEADMQLVLFDMAETDTAELFALRDTVNTLMAGSCPSVSTGETLPTPTTAGVCVTLTFPTDPATNFVVTIDTAGIDHIGLFTNHGPLEFEEDIHYLMQAVPDADLGLDSTVSNEPIADTGMYCKIQASNGVKECQQAFYVLQSHHDYCDHDTLTPYEEELVHIWESRCNQCAIERGYVEGLNDCPRIDCSDLSVIDSAYYVVAGSHSGACVAADTTMAFEWGGTFDTPADSYRWVSQAADNGNYKDPNMLMALFSIDATNMATLFALQDEADSLMTTGPCPDISSGDTLPQPTAAGVCVNLVFPELGSGQTGLPPDFVATVDATGVNNMAIFTAHGPTEFERAADDGGIHYLMSATGDLATTAEPREAVSEVPMSEGGHSHDHRRALSRMTPSQQAAQKAFGRRRRRKLADTGTCCTNAAQQGAWKSIVAYHDLCDHDDVPPEVEIGFHAYEASCANYFCNAVQEGYDGTICPSPPSPPPPPPLSDDGDTMEMGAVVAIIVSAAVVLAILVSCIVFLVCKEKAGKPVFTNLDATKASA